MHFFRRAQFNARHFCKVLLILAIPLFGDPIEETYFYADVGAGPLLPLPTVGVGYRSQKEHNGADFAVRASTIGLIDQVKASVLYLYYPRPDIEEQYYIGLGAAGFFFYPAGGGSFFNGQSTYGCSGEFIFGKQFTKYPDFRRFWQIQAGFPSYFWKEVASRHLIWVPTPIFSYGFIF